MEVKFSEAIYDAAYRILAHSCITDEKDQRTFQILCQVCDKYGISVRTYMAMIGEINKLMEEGNNARNQ